MEALCRATRVAAAAPTAVAKVSSPTSGRSSAAAVAAPRVSALSGAQLRSQFLGSGRVHVPTAASHQRAGNKSSQRGLAVRASFFDKLSKLFGSDPTEEEQTFAVYEVNDFDRGSPVTQFAQASIAPNKLVATLVPYTNKVCKPSVTDQIGESAGLCTGIYQGTPQGNRYETTYTHYLGEYGQISAMGPYYTGADSTMVVTGGTGIFVGARGIVKIHNVVPPIKLTYTYTIKGIQKLPESLTAPLTYIPDGAPIAIPTAAPTPTPATATS